MATWRSTSYTEKAPEAPNERFGMGSSAITRQFDLLSGSFQSRQQAAYDFLGYGQVVANPDQDPDSQKNRPYFLARVNPMPYASLAGTQFTTYFTVNVPKGTTVPDMTNRFYAVAISRTEPLGQPKGLNVNAIPGGTAAANYARARLTMEFSTLAYRVLDDTQVLDIYNTPNEGQILQDLGWQNTRYIIRQIEPFSRLIKIPYNRLVTNGKITPTAFPFREGGATLRYTQIRVPLEGIRPGVDFSRCGSMLGTLNSQKFDGYPASTLLYDNYTTREYQDAVGMFVCDITHTFIYMPHPSTGQNSNGGTGPSAGQQMGWNYVLDINDQKKIDYYAITSPPPGNNPPFQSAVAATGFTFADLFRP